MTLSFITLLGSMNRKTSAISAPWSWASAGASPWSAARSAVGRRSEVAAASRTAGSREERAVASFIFFGAGFGVGARLPHTAIQARALFFGAFVAPRQYAIPRFVRVDR